MFINLLQVSFGFGVVVSKNDTIERIYFNNMVCSYMVEHRQGRSGAL